MNRPVAPLRVVALLLFSAVLSSSAFALSSRVFVTPLGRDVAGCGALLTPCKTLAGAVGQASPGGHVVILTSGEYGPVTISKSLTIEATGVTALVQTTADAITVNAGSSDVVTVRGLTLAGSSHSGHGVFVNSAGQVHVEGCTISGFTDGVSAVVWSSGRLFVADTTARDNDQGVRVFSTGLIQVSVDHCTLVGNNNGMFIQDGTKTSVKGTVASGNIQGIGVQATGSTDVTVADCVVANNTGYGISTDGPSSVVVRVQGTTVVGNQLGLVQYFPSGPSQLLSRQDNTVEGNGGDTFGTIGTYSPK